VSDAFVVDASVGFSWVYPGQSSEETDLLLERIESGATVVVPSLWLLEVANSLLTAERRKLVRTAERMTALEKLSAMTFTVDEEAGRNAFGAISELASRHGLSVYDATYLETALRRNLPLCSRDGTLRKAAKKAGVKAAC
jgi:predicted nucleic acid-binding protein